MEDEQTDQPGNLKSVSNFEFEQDRSIDHKNGWSIQEWTSFEEFVNSAFDKEKEVHESFDSFGEAIKFVIGVNSYADRNSFFYDEQDESLMEDEGYFNSLECPNCLEELQTQLDYESIPRSDIPDPNLEVLTNEYQVDSHMKGHEKYVEKTWIQCGRHPEVSIMETETHYQEEN